MEEKGRKKTLGIKGGKWRHELVIPKKKGEQIIRGSGGVDLVDNDKNFPEV